MTPSHVTQRVRRGQPAFGSLPSFDDPLVAAPTAAKAAGDAVKIDR